MEQKIVVVGDGPTVTGFRLAGVSEAYVSEGREAEKKLEELLAREDVGIIVTNENLLVQADWRLRKKIESLARPTVVTVPNFRGEVSEAESLKVLVKRALGFELIK